MTVEYLRAVDEVMDYTEFPDVDVDTPYGVARDIGYFENQGFIQPDRTFYGAGMAVQNIGEHLLDISTIAFRHDDDVVFDPWMGRSQRLTFTRNQLLPARRRASNSWPRSRRISRRTHWSSDPGRSPRGRANGYSSTSVAARRPPRGMNCPRRSGRSARRSK